MKIVTADITGSLIVNNVDVTQATVSSSIWSGSVASEIVALQATSSTLVAASASFALVSSSYVATSASYSTTSASLSIRVTNTEATASTNTQASASFAAQSASLSTRLTTDETNITTLTNASASFAAQSASLSTRLTTDESNFTTTSGSISGRVTLIEGQYATTGSNNFTNLQYISATANAQGFTTTASLYTDGGLRVGKDSYVSGTAYFNNVIVYGTSSIQYITSSQVNVGSNIINLNTQTPAVRFGGMAVADSGSNAGITGSLLWDSVYNRWIYSNPSGSSYDGGMIISGPRNTTGLGNEVGTTSCYLMAGQGADHITSSAIYTDTNATCFYGNSFISSSGAASFPAKLSVGTSSISYPLTINANSTQTSVALMSGYSDAATRNWGIATNALAYGDFNIAQSSTLGGDPFSGTSRMYFSAAGTVCFSCQVCAPAFVGGTACFTSTVTAGSDVILSAANPFVYGGTAAGGVGVSNIGGQTYLKVYGASHATTPNITTFINAGSTSATINALGNVGIGISPSTKLHTYIADGTNDNRLIIQQGSNGYASAINLIANNDDGARYNYINSGTNGCTAMWQIGGGATVNTLALYTAGVERMRISSTGKVYIGTSAFCWTDTTFKTLQVGNGAFNNISNQTQIVNNIYYDDISYKYLTAGTANRIIMTTGGDIQFEAACSGNPGCAITLYSRMFICGNNGNVGIGTSSPTNGKLEVQQTATTAGLWVQTGGTTSSYVIADFRTGTNLSALQILGNGVSSFGCSVGINCAVPGYTLDVNGNAHFTSVGGTMLIESTQPTNASTLKIIQCSTGGNGNTDQGLVVQTNAGDGTSNIAHFYDFNSGSPISRVTIKRSGNVGIGTCTPQRQFVISNSGAAGMELSSNAASSTIISYNRATSTWLPLILQEGTGNVLIGTNSDTGYKLNVNGTLNVGSSLTIGSGISAGGTISTSGNVSTTTQVLTNSAGNYARMVHKVQGAAGAFSQSVICVSLNGAGGYGYIINAGGTGGGVFQSGGGYTNGTGNFSHSTAVGSGYTVTSPANDVIRFVGVGGTHPFVSIQMFGSLNQSFDDTNICIYYS